MSTEPEAIRLANWLSSLVLTYDQVCEDEPGGYLSEDDERFAAASAELRRLHAQSLADEELMREAMDEMEKAEQVYAHLQMWPMLDEVRATLSRLRQRLGE